MQATLLLELGLPEAPHSACLRWRREVPGCVARVFERHGIEFEGVRPMGSLRRLAFWIEGIPTLTTAGETFLEGPLERVARTADGTWTPVALEFAKRHGVALENLEVRGEAGARRLGVTRRRQAALSATVLPHALPELLDMLESKDRADSRRTMPFRQALAWLVVLLGDTRIRFTWHAIAADRYTYPGNVITPACRIAVPHFYEYHATLAQAGIRVDEATRREHLLRQLLRAANDLGGSPVASERQLSELSFRLDRPSVRIHRGIPSGLSAPFVERVAQSNSYCVAVRRDGGALAGGWIVVSEEDEESLDPTERAPSDAELAHQLFGRVLDDASLWLAARQQPAAKREAKRRVERFLGSVSQQVPLSASQLAQVVAAASWCESATRTLAFQHYPGAHLQLALQRASTARASKATRELIEAALQLYHCDSAELSGRGETKTSPQPALPVTDTAAALFLVLSFQHLITGFSARHLPLIEHDPLALRPLAERLFSLFLLKRWRTPIVGLCETAAQLWGTNGDGDVADADDADDVERGAPERPAFDQGVGAFLRHRARRYADKYGAFSAESVPETGEWTLADL